MRALAESYGGDVDRVKKSPLLVTAAIPYTGVCGGAPQEAAAAKENVEEGAHDLLVFPDGIRVHDVVPEKSEDEIGTGGGDSKGLTGSLCAVSTLVGNSLKEQLDLPALLEEEYVGDVWVGLTSTTARITDRWHSVCVRLQEHAVHPNGGGLPHDGVWPRRQGPELLEWLKSSAAEANKPLNLWTSSHYGGHRYAAACIVYPSGDWFGLLNDEDKAKGMIDAMNDEDPLRMYELWRGRMGLTAREMHQAVKERVEVAEAASENA
ncbi:unnamed protein product [Phytophthora fragariaefolia]|uniref:Unnamed protein product n=1 Tax=Phytophthora fragariaefolia TaxID=1490495 RepID=A0A9W6Y9F7_9STRA|nr:unnamed protein product [Phytophthora fragariaefolia]